MKIRYYINRDTGLPHIYKHNVDEAALEDQSQTNIEVPNELVPIIRELLAKHQAESEGS